jgi:hypothetical protein
MNPPPETVPTLADQGVDKDLAKDARKAWKLDLAKFEARLAKKITIAVAAAKGHGGGHQGGARARSSQIRRGGPP